MPNFIQSSFSANKGILKDLKAALQGGMPCLAECGGFLYLQQKLDGKELCGVLSGEGFQTTKLCRFGYVEIETKKAGLFGEKGQRIRGHEFHYWDCTENGEDCEAKKPLKGSSYSCMVLHNTMAAGFPHLYYYSNPEAVYEALFRCFQFQVERKSQKKWDSIAKPIDGLGLLETYIRKICRISASPMPPKLEKRALLVLCADHGSSGGGSDPDRQLGHKNCGGKFCKGAIHGKLYGRKGRSGRLYYRCGNENPGVSGEKADTGGCD